MIKTQTNSQVIFGAAQTLPQHASIKIKINQKVTINLAIEAQPIVPAELPLTLSRA